jgi:hypothetical protein
MANISNKLPSFSVHPVFYNLNSNIKKRGFRNVPWLKSAKIQITKNWVGHKIWQYIEKNYITDYDYLLNFLKFQHYKHKSYSNSKLKNFSHGTVLLNILPHMICLIPTHHFQSQNCKFNRTNLPLEKQTNCKISLIS